MNVRRAIGAARLVVFVLAAGCGPSGSPEEGGRRSLPIIGGDPSLDSPATVLLFNVGGGFSSCSGSIIAPRVVVTAKHCLGSRPSDPEAPQGLLVLTRPSLNSDYHYPVISGRTTEGDSVEHDDFAVLIVDRDIDLEGAPYYEVDRDLSDLEEGAEVRLIGYGLSSADGRGAGGVEKLETTDFVSEIFGELLYTYGRGACSGDSGGTALGPDGHLIAVMTRADCAGVTISERVDNFLDIVDWALEETGICVVHPKECDGVDNDCNDFVDEGCSTAGQPCLEDRSCADGLSCQEVGPESLCVVACDPFGAGGCAGGEYCDATGLALGRCVRGERGDGPAGSSCAGDTDCASLVCAGGACRIPCAPDLVACPWRMACAPDDGEGGLCAPVADAGGPRGLGEPCDDPSDCASALACVTEDLDRYCAPPCADDPGKYPMGWGCPAGFHCRADRCVRGELGAPAASCLDDDDCALEDDCVSHGGGGVCAPTCEAGCAGGTSCSSGRCLPDRGLPGARCAANGDCASGLCGHFPDGSQCTSPCSPAHGCPTGTVCELQADGTNLLCRKPPAPSLAGGGCSAAPRVDGVSWLGGIFLILALWVARRARPST